MPKHTDGNIRTATVCARMEFECPTLEQFEAKIGPIAKWAGNCYGAACQVVQRKLVPEGSYAVYGHWLGPIHEDSMFNRGAPFEQHGWVIMPDGDVCDPTRWAFEMVDPYVYWGASDYYDEGGNTFRTLRFGKCPGFDPTEDQIALDVEPKSRLFVGAIIGNLETPACTMTKSQVFWLANRSPRDLGEHARAIYLALQKANMRGLVPSDNWKMIFRK